MNLYRGLLEFLGLAQKNSKRSDSAIGKPSDDRTVPTLEKILASIKGLKPPTEARPAIPPPPPAINVAPPAVKDSSPKESATPPAMRGIPGGKPPAEQGTAFADLASKLKMPSAPTEARQPASAPEKPPHPTKIDPQSPPQSPQRQDLPTESPPPKVTGFESLKSPIEGLEKLGTPGAGLDKRRPLPMPPKPPTSADLRVRQQLETQKKPDESKAESVLSGFLDRMGDLFGKFSPRLAKIVDRIPRPQTPRTESSKLFGNREHVKQGSGKQKLFESLGKAPGTKGQKVSGAGAAGAGSKIAGLSRLAGVVGIIMAIGGAALYAGKKILDFAQGINEANRSVAKFDGRMAAAFAQLNIAELQSRMRTAQTTGGSSSALTNEMRMLIRDTQEIRDAIVTIKNTLGKGGVRLLRVAIKGFESLNEIRAIKFVAEMIEKNTKPKSTMTPEAEQINDIINGRFTQNHDPNERRNQPLPPL